ncbi:MAG TPA: cytochrome c3 family protein [Anaeromyxobacteraceae bacterium]|nr:cytochrome c3 family protein [Anaeromyxobacteraceae bacterium]
MNPKLPIALGLALALGCGARVATEAPEKQAPYVFPHSPHVDGDVACTNCHTGIEAAAKLEPDVRHVKVPATPSKQKACSDCHDSDPHVTVPKRSVPVRFTFSHAAHMPRANGDCKRCHQSLVDKGDTSPKRPPMAACTGCHNHQRDFSEARCSPCHLDLKGYKPETAFKHQGDWMRNHAALAKPTAESCAQCHDQTYCAKCHSPQTAAARPSIVFPESVERTFIHRGDYVSRHMIDQAANPSSCQRCHGPAFCTACHVQQNLTKAASVYRRPPSHDQPNWANAPAGTPLEHGRAARRDIASCAGCHDQGAAATCVMCHRSGTVNPHPSSFISKHRTDDRMKNAVCTACHTN